MSNNTVRVGDVTLGKLALAGNIKAAISTEPHDRCTLTLANAYLSKRIHFGRFIPTRAIFQQLGISKESYTTMCNQTERVETS